MLVGYVHRMHGHGQEPDNVRVAEANAIRDIEMARTEVRGFIMHWQTGDGIAEWHSTVKEAPQDGTLYIEIDWMDR